LRRWPDDFAAKMENREWRMGDTPRHLQSSIIHLRFKIGVTFGRFFFSNG
jgi:hypothetical protein